MAWTWVQRAGTLYRSGVVVAQGYAGKGAGKNSPAHQTVKNTGPLPCGRYRIARASTHKKLGALSMLLVPDASNEMFGRSAFYIHGDSLKAPGTASDGCIILPRPVREMLDESPDRDLLVVAEVNDVPNLLRKPK